MSWGECWIPVSEVVSEVIALNLQASWLWAHIDLSLAQFQYPVISPIWYHSTSWEIVEITYIPNVLSLIPTQLLCHSFPSFLSLLGNRILSLRFGYNKVMFKVFWGVCAHLDTRLLRWTGCFTDTWLHCNKNVFHTTKSVSMSPPSTSTLHCRSLKNPTQQFFFVFLCVPLLMCVFVQDTNMQSSGPSSNLNTNKVCRVSWSLTD